ncbi:hypothetical protein LOAG_09792 [Loa loa]|uniref:Uncharacterized protein n=1 Tax=Loa loa TaxID=7209 RepID=A0A1S0TR76_LOALO|nr:hypothetical protein LOAG_09792 [Loa loa]EFO18704.1 hypothetical protein LOAG_09792 [Loa loa]
MKRKGKGGKEGLVGGSETGEGSGPKSSKSVILLCRWAMIGRYDAGGSTGSGTSQNPPPLHPSTFPNENTHYSVHFLRAQFDIDAHSSLVPSDFPNDIREDTLIPGG